MLAKAQSASILGIEAHPVEVEVDISSRGLPHFTVVGLPDAAVRESRERVRSALKNIGFNFPLKPITINLAPADLKKEGSAFDLPIALALVACERAIEPESIGGYLLAGELALDGRLKPIRGALSMALLARKQNLSLLIPALNVPEAAVVDGVRVYGLETLTEAVDFLNGEFQLEPASLDMERVMAEEAFYEIDFQDVKGQEHGKRALEVAASGGHNVLMIGPPGSGKTMLARRLPTVLPFMTLDEAIETTRIHSVSGMLTNGSSIVSTRPFRTPHHTISDVALIGGGAIPRPGEVSLAHNGVLFLDELPEFKRNVLEVLRQPLEGGEVTVSRASASMNFPADFTLVAAMNPCPCGYYGDPAHDCICSPSQIHRYRRRVSGPLMDRIDIHIEVPAVPYRELSDSTMGESSEDIRERIFRVKRLQMKRFSGERIYANGQMQSRHLRKYCPLTESAGELLETAMQKLGLSARAHSRIIKLSRTIADMDGAEKIDSEHISEAIQYRTLDRGF